MMQRKMKLRLIVLFSRVLLLGTIIAFAITYYTLNKFQQSNQYYELQHEVNDWLRVYHSPADLKQLDVQFKREVEHNGANSVLCRLFDQDQKVALSTPTESWPALPTIPADMQVDELYSFSFQKGDDDFLVAFMKTSNGEIFNYAISIEEDTEFLNDYVMVASIAVLFSLLISCPIVFIFAKNESKGINKVIDAARYATESGDFTQMVDEDHHGIEQVTLAKSFNMMQVKITRLIKEIKEMGDNVAHDIRRPLTSIKGCVETTMLSQNQDVESYKNMAISVIEDCNNLESLVSTMLEISEVESSKMKKEELDITTLIANICEIFQANVELNQQQLLVDFSEQAILIHGNAKKLQRMITNLLDNACKYCDQGATIHCQLTESDGKVLLSIKDDGPGIKKTDQEHIFERFYRCDSSRSTIGNGLGLSYVDMVVQQHDGNIRVVSEVGNGTEFVIELPTTHCRSN